MYSAINYELDNGVNLAYIVALYIGYNNEYSSRSIVNDELIPQILLSELQWFSNSSCFTKQVSARFVVVSSVLGDTLKIAYPFRPGSPKWFTFWEQLQSPNIVSVKGFGEKVTDKYLKHSLGIA